MQTNKVIFDVSGHDFDSKLATMSQVVPDDTLVENCVLHGNISFIKKRGDQWPIGV